MVDALAWLLNFKGKTPLIRVEKPRVTFITSSMNLGGAERQLLLLCNELRCHFEVEILTLDGIGPLLAKYKEQFPEIRIIESSNRLVLFVLVKLVRYIKVNKPKIVITWLYKADILGGIATKLVGKIPVIWSARNSSVTELGIFRKLVLLLLARTIPTAIVANGKPAINFHKTIGYPNHKIVRIPNLLSPWVYTVKNKSRLINPSKNIAPMRVGIASRQVPGKGILEAISAIENCDLNIQLLLIGQKTTQTAILESSESYKNYDVKEITDDSELSRWFQGLDLYLMSSTHWESQPNSLLEAIAIGCPVLVSNKIHLDFTIPNQFSFDFVDDLSFKIAIVSLLKLDSVDLKNMVNSFQSHILREFSEESIVNRWIYLISLHTSIANE